MINEPYWVYPNKKKKEHYQYKYTEWTAALSKKTCAILEVGDWIGWDTKYQATVLIESMKLVVIIVPAGVFRFLGFVIGLIKSTWYWLLILELG